MIGNPNAVWQAGSLPRMKATRQPAAGSCTDVAGLHRITGQRIVLHADDAAECTVFGRRHRRPVEQRVPLTVAVDLARRGVHTVVRVAGA